MKRSFPPPARGALVALAGVLAASAACEPDQGVQPGAPVLMELTILQGGTSPTTITAATPECATGVATTVACLPMGDATAPPDGLCRLASAMNWCTCVPDEMDDHAGAWNCDPFANVTAVIAVFDRLLDTAPLDPAEVDNMPDIVMTSASAGAPAFEMATDYASNGNPNGLVFNLYSPFFGNFRANGPSLFSVPAPAFPSDATVTVTLNADRVQAKDGVTPFTGNGLLQGGMLVFTTAPFAGAVVPPADAAMDPHATIGLTNVVDTAPCPTTGMDMMDPADDVVCVLASHVTATANGAPVAITVTNVDGANYTVGPAAADGKWPAGATIVITLDAQTQNALGQPISAAASEMFTAP